jgi:hypothetical protein
MRRAFGRRSIIGVTSGFVLVTAACASRGAEPGAVASPALSAAQVVAVAGDPAGWAAAAHARCGRHAVERKLACYDEVLLAILAAEGTRVAMETLEHVAERDADIQHHGHVLAHHIGIAAYSTPDRVGEAFTECTPSFQSGCYHGVVQAYFGELQLTESGEVSADQLDALCAAYRGPNGDRWLLFQCAHGMGHGLVALFDDHLPRALDGCELLLDAWERESCYGGAFMENVVSATMPHHAPRAGSHHPATGGASPHAHHGHTAHEGHAAGHEAHAHAHARGQGFPALDPDDPHYPCSALPERYLFACYSMQTSAVLFWSEGDIQAGVELCDGAPEVVRHVCYISLGRDINAYARQDHARALGKCREVAAPHQAACLIGVAKNLIDVTADPGDGAAFCDAVPAGINRERCFRAVGEQLAVLEPGLERRARFCASLDARDAQACGSGAGLPEPSAPGQPPGH